MTGRGASAGDGIHSGTISVDAARDRVLASVEPLPAVELPISEALDLTLAEDIVAKLDLPPFANSAMDGYALRSVDTTRAETDTPVELHVVGQAAAGYLPDPLVETGCAVRIMTGAPVPSGTDAVVRFEHTEERSGDNGVEGITLRRPVPVGENIRPAGEDVRCGSTVLTAGTRVRPAGIGLMAAVGYAEVVVHPRPRIGVLVTGDELVDPGAPLGPGQIWNSNGPMIEAHVRQCGGEPIMLGVASDTIDAIRTKLSTVTQLDLLITTGGVSVGDYDVVKDVLQAEGHIDLWKIRIKPGKPLAFGSIDGTPLLGLPGNPVAASVAFTQFARPMILTMLGRRSIAMPEVHARLLDRIDNRGNRQQFVRVVVESGLHEYVARLAGGQGSAMMSSLASANGLLVIPETCPVAEPGSILPVQMPDWNLGE